MIAAIVNAVSIVAGSILGMLGGGRLKESHMDTIVKALAIIVVIIGVIPAIETASILTLIVCLVLGTILGEMMNIERRLDTLGDWLKARFARGNSAGRFTEGFVTASLLFCVGSMAVMGSLEAGINRNYSVIFSKSVIDGVMAVTFAATFGLGVAFASFPVLVYQGALTLLAAFAAPYLSTAVVTEMSAVGGVLLIGTGLNMLSLSETRIKVGNMLPSIFLPILYIPFVNWLTSFF